MFVPKYLFDRFMAMQDATFQSGQRITETGLQRVLAAKDSEVAAVIAAKTEQVEMLQETVAELRKLIDHERQRAEAAVDILLTKNGEAGPIRNADLIREVAAKEASAQPATAKATDPMLAFKKVMEAVSGVGEDEDDGPVTSPNERLTVGGIS